MGCMNEMDEWNGWMNGMDGMHGMDGRDDRWMGWIGIEWIDGPMYPFIKWYVYKQKNTKGGKNDRQVDMQTDKDCH